MGDGADVDVWLVDVPTTDAEALVQEAEGILSSAERQRAARFRSVDARHQFVLGHATVRLSLSAYVAMPPAAWEFQQDAHGRPEIRDQRSSALRFSLSHTHGLVAIAVTNNMDVAVDVEDMTVEVPTDQIADRFFASIEAERLRGMSKHESRLEFFRYWTLKEAYLKALGEGIGVGLDRVVFALGDVEGPRLIQPEGVADWQFELRQPTHRHCLALAARSSEPVTVRLRRPLEHGATLRGGWQAREWLDAGRGRPD